MLTIQYYGYQVAVKSGCRIYCVCFSCFGLQVTEHSTDKSERLIEDIVWHSMAIVLHSITLFVFIEEKQCNIAKNSPSHDMLLESIDSKEQPLSLHLKVEFLMRATSVMHIWLYCGT